MGRICYVALNIFNWAKYLFLSSRMNGVALAKPRLQVVFFLAFSLASIVPILFLGWWVIDSARENEYVGVEEKHLLVAKNLTLALSRYAQDIISVLNLAATTQVSIDNKPLNDLLYSQNIIGIWIFDKDGLQKGAIKTGTSSIGSSLTESQLKAVSDVAGTRKTVFLPIQLNSENQPSIMTVSPCTSCDGYLVAEIETRYILQLQKKIEFGKLGHAAIVDHTGNILAHPNKVWVSEIKSISKVSIVKRMMNKETGVEQFYSPAKEANMIAGFSHVAETGWGVMVPQPVSELEDHINHIKSVAMRVSILGLLFAMLTSWFLANKLTHSARKLSEIANTLASGETTIELPDVPTFTREESELGEAFRRMTRRLNSKNTELLYSAQHDGLTGLANRNLLKAHLNEKIIARDSFFLALIDLNGFKDINEHWSYAHGDALLKIVAERLTKIVNDEGFVSRIGGDEFAIVFNSMTPKIQIEKIVCSLINELKRHYSVLETTLRVNCSFGLAGYPEDADNTSDLMQCTDLAMDEANEQSTPRFKWYETRMRSALNERVELTQALRDAIMQRQFIMHYQPKVDAHTYEILGLEALVRWQHPTKGLIYPDIFIQIAENTGLIIPLGELILDLICQDITAWKEEVDAICTVSMNLSIRQFEDDDLAHMIGKVMSGYTLSAKEFEFEITESIFVGCSTQVEESLRQLRGLGCQISVDDFGIGESSLARLKDIDVDIIKIDKSFIDDLATNEKVVEILNCIVTMSQALGLKVVVEGVETTAQLEVVQKINCTEIQGFIFSQGVDAESVVALLKGKTIAPIG